MNRKLLSLLVTLVAMFGCLGSLQAQEWTWTGETPSSGNSYYIYTVNQKKFLNDNNGLDATPSVQWKIGGTFSSKYTLTSANNKQFAMYRSGNFWNYSYNIVTNATSKSGSDVNLKSDLSDGKYSFYRESKDNNWSGDRNVASTSTGIKRAKDSSFEWYFITTNQVDVYNNNYANYTSAYEAANTLKQQLGNNTPDRLDNAISTYATVNYTTIVTAITELQAATQAAATTFYTNVSIVNKTESLGSVTLSCDGAIVENNTYTDEQLGTVAPKHNFTLTATPAADCYLEGWYSDEACTELISDLPSKSDVETIKNVEIEGTAEQTNIVYYAKFAQKPNYLSTITANATTGGKVSVSAGGTTTEYGNTATANHSNKSIDAPKHQYTLSAQAEDGYVFVGWAKSENATSYLSTEASYSVEITAGIESTSATYYAIFHTDYYSSVIVSAGNGGKVFVSTTRNATPEYDVTSTATNTTRTKNAPNHTYYLFAQPEEGYEFVAWVGATVGSNNSVTVKAESMDEENPSSVSLSAVFGEKQQGADVAPGKYYIKNVDTGKYLKCASKELQNDIEVDNEKDLFELIANGNNYDIRNSNGRYLYWSAFGLEENATRNTYAISFSKTSDGYYNLYYDGRLTNYYLRVNENSISSDAFTRGKWQLIPAETANLKVNANMIGTFVAPFDVVLPDGIIAYTAGAPEDTKVPFTKNAEGGETLKAGTAVILENTTDAKIEKTYSGLAITSDYIETDYLFGYNIAGQIIPNGNYALQNQSAGIGFYVINKATNDYSATKNRCYLKGNNSEEVKFTFFMVGEEETAVEGVEATNVEVVGYYSLNGTKLTAPQKGVNLIKMSNGSVKKVFVK